MIITRTPFRLSLGGGGTDLPSYYSKHGGFIFAAAIDKYMFININRPMVDDKIRMHYSQSEEVDHVDHLKHDLAREALRINHLHQAVEIVSLADVPAGAGMGSSSAYTVGLLKGIHQLKQDPLPQKVLAEEACRIEIDILKKPIGKQDQYVAAFGGLPVLEIEKDGEVKVRQANVTYEVVSELERNILLFYTGKTRSADAILSHQDKAAKEDKGAVVEYLHCIKEIGKKILAAIERGNLRSFGSLLDEHWETKKRLSGKISSRQVDRLYEKAKKKGALGGKIIGAGGGGFLMLYGEKNHQKLREAMTEEGLRYLPFRFDFEGSKILTDFMNTRDGMRWKADR